MSDSDDTDILLLIPPNFFLIDQEEEISCNCSFDFDGINNITEQTNNICAPMSSNYNYLPSKQRSELEAINARLSQIERNSSVSEGSTISNWAYARKHNMKSLEFENRTTVSPKNFAHSTPKPLEVAGRIPPVRNDDNGVLSEIDHFLEDNSKKNHLWNRKDVRSLNFVPENVPHDTEKSINENREYFARPNPIVEASYKLSSWEPKRKPEENYELISLTEIWGKEKANDHLLIQEERMRRQHCEKTIQNLQAKLLDYEQKISVAVEIDKTKDAAIRRHNEENGNLHSQIKKLDDQIRYLEDRNIVANEQLQIENAELKSKKEILENELAQAVKLTSNFQDKNEILESKIGNLTKASNEIGDIYRKQLQDMEIRLSNSQRSEELLVEELNELKKRIAKFNAEHENVEILKAGFQKQIELQEGELVILKQQKQSSYDKYREEKNRADILEKHKLALQRNIDELTQKEANLVKELETQRTSLKAHYQRQLEQVVSQKLKEFQSQLDSVEENLKGEAKQRERVLADRAIKQIELINEKNEQEIILLQEKHNEEIELYKIQNANATKTIEELEEKLNFYKSRRAEIAEKLHNVMETQWRKALEILTSPQSRESSSTINPEKYDRDKLDGVPREKDKRPENENFETPNRNRKHDPNVITDKLHAYIEMLLEKSPRDLQNLDQILKMPKSRNVEHSKSFTGQDNQSRRDGSSKRPWK